MSSFCPRVLRLSLPLFLLASVHAQWRPLPANFTPPSLLAGITLTPTPDGDLLLLGSTVVPPLDWLWTGTHWSGTQTGIPRRSFHAAAADGDTGDILVFGGFAGAVQLFDTWRFRGSMWQQLAPANTPPALTLMSMAYDPATAAMILVGKNAQNVWETWSFVNDWTQVTATLPSLVDVALYSDSVRGVVGLFGNTATDLEVHVLGGSSWTNVASLAGTTFFGRATFDDRRGRAIYYHSQLAQSGTTMEFDGLTLRQVSTMNGPTPALGIAMAFDARRGEAVMVTTGSPVRVWGYQQEAVPFATPYGSPCNDPAFRLAIATGDVPTIGGAHRLVAQAASGTATFAILGLSHTFDNGLLPRMIAGSLCEQRVEQLATVLLLTSPASLSFAVANSAGLLGVRYDAQMLSIDAGGLVDVTNGLEVQIGSASSDNTLTETFASSAARDPATSGDPWAGGAVTPVEIGGDGRHGSFDPSFGVAQAANTWQWNTENTMIPASATLSGSPVTVTDGRFFFTDFTLPAGSAVNFVGAVPAQIFVRGKVEIGGSLRLNGAAMATFNARGGTTNTMPFVAGQPGGAPGAGGGFGGRGGDECEGTGPIIVAGEVRTDGANGEDVKVAAGHAYAAQAAGTGGSGTGMNPPTGIPAPNTPLVGFVYRAYFAPGGGGGGFWNSGGTASVTPLTNLQVGPVPATAPPFPVFPLPIGASSLEHFAIGGGGGGGGGTHAFGTIYVTGDVYVAGSAGSGGGGACAVRAGGDLTVLAGARCESKGGAGAVIDGRDPNGSAVNTTWGISSPGGGGSGGSFLMQSGGNLSVAGDIDTSGGDGSRTQNIGTVNLNVNSSAGAGSPGFYRLEAASGVAFTGTGVPSYNSALNRGALMDGDDRTGSRSIWLRPASLELPRYVRYELVADINGSTVLYSDDPAVSSVAADDPAGAVYLRFQGAQVDALTGLPLPATFGPWRTTVVDGPDTLNSDRAEALRFDLVLDKSFGSLQVRELRVIWR